MKACALLTAVLLALSVPAQDADLPLWEKTVKEAGVSFDGPGLLKLFRDRTPSNHERETLALTVRKLGARSFPVRNKAEQDLIRAGRLALPALRPALRDTDIEIVRRAERCIAAIEHNPDAPLLAAAAHLIGIRKPAEGIETLLGYLPTATDEYVIESIHAALSAIALTDGKVDSTLLAAMKDREPARRMAATVVIGQADEMQRQSLRPLLADSDLEVRLRAATALLRTGDGKAAAVVMQLLTDAPLPVAGQAEEVLAQIAGEKAPGVALVEDAKGREACRTAWEKWWKASAASIDWKRQAVEAPALGLTLVCEAHLADGGRVFECGRDGKARWTVKCSNPIDAQMLPGNRVLIADCHGGKVFEADREGRVLWTHNCNSPISVQRLANGNTFIASHNEILEVKRDGSKVFSLGPAGYVFYARKLPGGTIVVVSSDGILAEIDTAGKELSRLNLGGMTNWAGVEALPGGRWLVARSGASEVVEVDRSGKTLWKVSVRNPNSAVRLKNGNTIVASHDDHLVYEFDRNGKEVWRRQVEGSPFRARRR